MRSVAGRQLLEPTHPALDGYEEPFLFRASRIDDVFCALLELGVHTAHLVNDDADHFDERRLPSTEKPGVTNCPAQDSAQHIASSLIRGKNTIREQERYCTTVISDDAK
jgi:hypothetical protein